MYFIVLFTFFAFTCASSAQNVSDTATQMNTVINPDCTECQNTALLYTKIADEEKDLVYHNIWDCSSNFPTIIYIVSSNDTSLEFDWKGETLLKITSSTPILYSYTMVLHNLVEYLDTGNLPLFTYEQQYRNILLRHTKWNCTVVDTDHQALLHVNTTLQGKDNTSSGVINLQWMLQPTPGRMSNFPRLYHTPRDTVVDVSLVNLTGTFRDRRTRFALRYIIVSEDDAADSFYYKRHDNIDDEYMPGVFRMLTLLTPSAKTKFGGGYVEFRPVAFKEVARDMGSSVGSDLWSFNKSEIPRDCLADRFYAHHNRRKLLVQEAIASFGEIGDGFYNETKYIAWTYVMGFGSPPEESPSVSMVMVMAITMSVQLGAVLLLGCGLTCMMTSLYGPRRLVREA